MRFSKGAQVFEQPINLLLGEFHAFAGPTNLGDALSIVQWFNQIDYDLFYQK